MTAPADLRGALCDALALLLENARTFDGETRAEYLRLVALASSPPSVRELTASAGFRAGTHWIRYDVDGLHRELRTHRIPRARGQRSPDAYAVESRTYVVESRTVRGVVGGEWRWWLPTIEALDAVGQLVEVAPGREVGER